jgi:hypothetical protein
MFIKLAQLSRFWTNAKAFIASGYVAQETGKGLSANDLTDALKTNYDAAYTHSQASHAPATAQANVIETVKVNGTALTPTSKAVNITVPTTVAQLTDAGDYARKSELGNVYKYMGSVANYAALPTLSALGTNDPAPVYDCQDTGKNYAWNGTSWDDLGGTLSVEAATDADIDALFE